jgi:hypothetical protein
MFDCDAAENVLIIAGRQAWRQRGFCPMPDDRRLFSKPAIEWAEESSYIAIPVTVRCLIRRR